MKISELEKYKHDTIGKFPTLKSLIEVLEDNDYQNKDNALMFQTIHEVLIKMVTTSKKLIEGPLKQNISLTVLAEEADLSLKKMELVGVNVRYKILNGKMEYFYFTSENSGDHNLTIEKIKLVLPISEIKYQSSER